MNYELIKKNYEKNLWTKKMVETALKKHVITQEEYEIIVNEPYVPETLEEAKAAKLAALKAERDTKEVEPIEYNGHLYDYDEKARDRINAAIIALELAGTEAALEWTCADNTDATVTAADLKNIIAAVAVRSNTLHVAYRAAKAAVEAAESKEDLEAIVLN